MKHETLFQCMQVLRSEFRPKRKVRLLESTPKRKSTADVQSTVLKQLLCCFCPHYTVWKLEKSTEVSRW